MNNEELIKENILLKEELEKTTPNMETKQTKGLNIIPGKVMPLNHSFNIGWNSIKTIGEQGKITIGSKDTFYFNHSYGFSCNKKFLLAET